MTFRRVLAALFLVSVASLCHARGLVIVGREAIAGTPVFGENGLRGMEDRMTAASLDVFQRWGLDYRVMPQSAVTTEMARTGLVYYKRDRVTSRYAFDTNGPSEQFDWVIIMNASYGPQGYQGGQRNNPPWPPSFNGCYPCSMSVGGTTRAPLIPQLWLGGAMNGEPGGGADNLSLATTSSSTIPCSTGVATSQQPAYPSILSVPTMPGTFMSAANISAGYALISSVGGVAGGVRAIVKRHLPYFWAMQKYNGNINSNAADSALIGAGADSVAVWERPFTGLYAGASNTQPIKPIVFANIMGASPCYDSVTRVIPCEFDEGVLMLALARLDSITAGKVFNKKRTAAIVISGGFERTLRRLPGGANDADSSVIKASIDSLAAYKIPVTVTVNVDSVASYPNEKAWWVSRGLDVRFAPVCTFGAKDTTNLGTSRNWSNTLPVDIFGRNRQRAFFGDSLALHSGTSSTDSSIYQGLLYLKDKASSVGLTPLSGTVIAPLDDWSPKNMRWKSNAIDSLARVFRMAGYTAALVDVQRDEGDINRIRSAGGGVDRVRGWYGKEYAYRIGLTGEDFKFIGHTGYNINGGARQQMTASVDSTAVPYAITFGAAGPTGTPMQFAPLGRFWHGWCHDQFTDVDWFQSDGQSGAQGYADVSYPLVDGFRGFRKSSVLKMHVSDFSGQVNGPPARPGWWTVKSLARQFNAINALAGRTVVSLGFPEDCEP